MVKFSAAERDIVALVRFLARRAPGGLWMVPLEASHRDQLRFRRTPRPFLARLTTDDGPAAWGLLPFATPVRAAPTRRLLRVSRGADGGGGTAARLRVDPDESGLIVLMLGAAEGPERRRAGVLATRDPLPRPPAALAADTPDAPETTNEADADALHALRADLVEKGARRLRRRAERRGDGRWFVAENPHPPQGG